MITGMTDGHMIIGIAVMIIAVGVDRIRAAKGVVEAGGRLPDEEALAREIHCQEDHVMARLEDLKVKVVGLRIGKVEDKQVKFLPAAVRENRALVRIFLIFWYTFY